MSSPISSVIGWVRNLINTILSALGLSGKKATILLLGLDNAGKTTLLHRLRTGTILQFPPTDRPNLESFKEEGVNFVGWDLGGHEAVRHLWEDYVPDSNAVVFLIDSADFNRFDEVREELDALVGSSVGEQCAIDGVPLAILLNKCDLDEAVTSQVVAEAIGYEEISMRHGEGMVNMFRISVLKGQGYQEAFRWIASFL